MLRSMFSFTDTGIVVPLQPQFDKMNVKTLNITMTLTKRLYLTWIGHIMANTHFI